MKTSSYPTVLRDFVFPSCLLALVVSASAQESPVRDESQMAKLVERASLLKLQYPDDVDREPPQLNKAPVLRCSDPTRDEVDGALWLWLEGQRPVAGLCILLYANGKWNYEHVSLSDDALQLTGRPAWSWQSPAEKRTWVTLEGEVPAAGRARQTAIKALARRLEMSEVRRGETFPLRLLDRPIYTYADEKQGLLDAALFAVSYGTNPELLVQIEARAVGDKRHWQAAFARLSAAEIAVRLDGKEIWKIEAKTANDPKAAYYGVNELPSP